MITWEIQYQLKVAEGAFYPRILLLKATSKGLAEKKAKKLLAENINDTEVEAVIITNTEPL